jgi:hypothetical protein
MVGGTLHITNGDGAAGIIQASGIAGDILPWRDPMHHGPMPDGLDLAGLSAVRAAYLSELGHDALDAFRDRDDNLRRAGEYETFVLWFEHDLLDQLQILQILDWFAAPRNTHDGLMMICVGVFEGMPNFRGLGQLSPAQLATLWPAQKLVSQAILQAARSGWKAFRSSDPRAIQIYLAEADEVTPFLGPCLQRHLQEFPDSATGLMLSECNML